MALKHVADISAAHPVWSILARLAQCHFKTLKAASLGRSRPCLQGPCVQQPFNVGSRVGDAHSSMLSLAVFLEDAVQCDFDLITIENNDFFDLDRVKNLSYVCDHYHY